MLVNADSRRIPLRDGSVHCVVTSPPYWGLRDYQVDGQIGLEQTPEAYVENMVAVMREVWRVLRDDGTLWLNLGDSYAGSGGSGGDYNEGGLREGQPRVRGIPVKSKRTERGAGRWGGGNNPASGCIKPKDLVGIPWMVAFALRADGWYLRSDIVWAKPNPMPESVTDRPTKSHEYIFLLSKSPQYYYDADAVREPMSEATKERDKNKFSGAFKGQFRGTPNEERWQDGRPIEKPHFYNELGRNRRTVWTVATAPYPGAHYAVYPPALIAPCVLAGTSQRGVCPVCGAPWVRVVERTQLGERDDTGRTHSLEHQRVGKTPVPERGWEVERNTLGWHPSCACSRIAPDLPIIDGVGFREPYPPVPATVLDPFAGSGTTGEVCRNTGRQFVGLDISLKYLTEQALPRAERKTAPDAMAKLPMFAIPEAAS